MPPMSSEQSSSSSSSSPSSSSSSSSDKYWDDSTRYQRRLVELKASDHERTDQTELPPNSTSTKSSSSSSSKSSTKSKTATQRRSVSFANKLDVKEVPHVRDMTPEEVHEVWYTADDFDKIKKSMIVTIRLMMANKPISHDQCIRGLEFRTPSGAKKRKKNKLDALTAVWNEQVSQWNDNKTDEFAIAFVYRQQTNKCRDQAIRFGEHDEKAAQENVLEDSMNSGMSLGSTTDAENPIHVGSMSQKISPAAA